MHRPTAGLPERRGGDHADAQAGEGAGACTDDDRVDIREFVSGLGHDVQQLRHEEFAVRARVDRHALGEGAWRTAVQGDQPGRDRGGRGVQRNDEHGYSAYVSPAHRGYVGNTTTGAASGAVQPCRMSNSPRGPLDSTSAPTIRRPRSQVSRTTPDSGRPW